MADLLLYTHPMSRGRVARWMLEELGGPYRVEQLDYATTMKSPEYLAINPMGKVPTLVHGDAIVTELAAICAYLAAAFPDAGLAPEPGTPASAAYHRWMFFAAGPAEAAITNKAFGLIAPPEKSTAIGYGTYETMLDALESAVAGRQYIAGDRFSAADVTVGSQIGYALMLKTIEARPEFVRYWDGIKNRPAAIKARELDDTALPKPAG